MLRLPAALPYHARRGAPQKGHNGLRVLLHRWLSALVAPWLALALLAAPLWGAQMPGKDQDRILPDTPPAGGKDNDRLLPAVPEEQAPLAPGADDEPAGQNVPFGEAEEEQRDLEALISEDIPDLEAVELTEDSARRALDAFAEVFGKFDDEEIAKYPTLQEFAEKSPEGKKFAEIIRKHGFGSVREWNNVISNIGFAFTSIEEGHDDEVFRQIKQVEARADLPKERKERLLKYLRALVPSLNNRKVVQQLMQDPAYMRKLDLLEGGGGVE